MAIKVEIRQMHTGRPVKPDFKPVNTLKNTRKAIQRSDVKSAKELSAKNREIARADGISVGAKANEIQNQVSSGNVDILS